MSPTARVERDPVVNIVGLSKTFGTHRVLDNVGMTIHAGEVHGLLGENGSGKSTLIKVLAGFHEPDPGSSLQVRGRDIALPISAGGFRELGISFVHQDLALVPDLSVVENLRVGQVVAGSSPWISWRRERDYAKDLFATYGIDIDPAEPVSALSATEKALLALMRAVDELDDRRTLLVLDEPTVFLPREGTDLLFSVVRNIIADRKAAVLFVSHDLDEVLTHTDRVTILRDGKPQGTHSTSSLDTESLIELIVGSAVADERHNAPRDFNGVAALARVRELSCDRVNSVDLSVHPGEIVGITGIAGSGYDDVLPALYGASRADGGELSVGEHTLALVSVSPIESLEAGVVYIPPDRKVEGSAPELSVADNVTLPVLSRLVRPRHLKTVAMRIAETCDVRPRDPSATYGSLSGGNQQKALFGKWLQLDPRLILLAEPTQGVDVGARARIFELLRATADGGAAIMVASSDYEQLAVLCDRVLVMANGDIVTELTGSDIAKRTISDTVLSSTREVVNV
ncbi:sugar ABC transporter ATP-binding protein [Gordonia desulfuricans]|uniref:Sugar ABC transporter ATP-binding protein n=1 Tax=Gordonia desulfuricans TaxID=89051 RepID=A0A7K3LUS3_9ACTN|nr:sugar ABC transporter ATP-binding protein [Gordonia desulfuricans]KOY49576.1 ATPase [Gordonia sp. NB41Y]NDK92023.1 sugar ABC transporter ATP-binding protein [Gordonia desulfuricans]